MFSRLKRIAPIIFALALTACATAQNEHAAFGRVEVSSIPLDPALTPQSATYTPSGRVLVTYSRAGETDPRQINLAIMDDDGANLRTFFSQRLPDRAKDNGIRYMVFADNRRIFLGDFIIECAPSIDACDDAGLIPVNYPAEIASGDHVGHRWSEMIVAPDNRHISWTTLLANYSALVFIGELERTNTSYEIRNPRIISSVDPFSPDPAHADGVLAQRVRGGEVKQFVHGGAAISMVGANRRDLPASVVQDLVSGAVTGITDDPGYTETTIFSPDERLGITMTTRFSERTDLAILGLMPRPYPDSLNMGLSMHAYTYGVTGVRASRRGNVGPALIDIHASQHQPNYRGANLNTSEDWVYYSPMSWHPSSTRAMWMEGRSGDSQRRIQIVRLPDYAPGPEIAAQITPDAIPYASSDLSGIPALARQTRDRAVRVYGRHSGHIDFHRATTGVIEKTYAHFSDDGQSFYDGSERNAVNPRGTSTYTANVRVTGAHTGLMDLTMTFGPLGGDLPSRLIFDPDQSGAPSTRGYAEYDGQRLSVEALSP